jgi:hypothetical protein
MSPTARLFTFVLAPLFFASCTVYKSSDRKRFETDTSAAHINNLVTESCSNKSVREYAQASKLVKIYTSSHDGGSVFLWEHIVDDISFLETDNLKGVYCLYE